MFHLLNLIAKAFCISIIMAVELDAPWSMVRATCTDDKCFFIANDCRYVSDATPSSIHSQAENRIATKTLSEGDFLTVGLGGFALSETKSLGWEDGSTVDYAPSSFDVSKLSSGFLVLSQLGSWSTANFEQRPYYHFLCTRPQPAAAHNSTKTPTESPSSTAPTTLSPTSDPEPIPAPNSSRNNHTSHTNNESYNGSNQTNQNDHESQPKHVKNVSQVNALQGPLSIMLTADPLPIAATGAFNRDNSYKIMLVRDLNCSELSDVLGTVHLNVITATTAEGLISANTSTMNSGDVLTACSSINEGPVHEIGEGSTRIRVTQPTLDSLDYFDTLPIAAERHEDLNFSLTDQADESLAAMSFALTLFMENESLSCSDYKELFNVAPVVSRFSQAPTLTVFASSLPSDERVGVCVTASSNCSHFVPASFAFTLHEFGVSEDTCTLRLWFNSTVDHSIFLAIEPTLINDPSAVVTQVDRRSVAVLLPPSSSNSNYNATMTVYQRAISVGARTVFHPVNGNAAILDTAVVLYRNGSYVPEDSPVTAVQAGHTSGSTAPPSGSTAPPSDSTPPASSSSSNSHSFTTYFIVTVVVVICIIVFALKKNTGNAKAEGQPTSRRD